MKIRILTFILGTLIGLYGCAKKNYYCGFATLSSTTINHEFPELKSYNVDSEILSFSDVVSNNSTVSTISGTVYEKSMDVHEVLPFANIWVKDIKTDSIVGTTSNLEGNYKLVLPKSVYNLEIQFVGYNSLRINNFKVGKGKTLKLSVTLGEGDGKTEYEPDSVNSFIKVIK